MNAPFAPRRPEDPAGPLPARRHVRKAVILAAGRGRRMGKLTADRPKAALDLAGHALLDWQIAALKAAGVEEIAVVTGHGAAALGGRTATYIHSPGWASGTQVETLLCARDWIGDEPVVVSYGDIVYHPCAALALLERPGELVIGYDADHRWLWKARFGNWLKDSETFVLDPGQVLTEIGGVPTDIEAVDGQFMGLMLFTPAGLDQLARRFEAAPAEDRRRLDFTRLLSALIADGVAIHTAANLMPWMEVDSAKDLKLAERMTQRDEIKGTWPKLIFPTELASTSAPAVDDVPDPEVDTTDDAPAPDGDAETPRDRPWDDARLAPYAAIRALRVETAFAVQNWGRSGSTFVQALFDDHPQVLSTPNFYSRSYYMVWATAIGPAPDDKKIEIFLERFSQWWDSGRVDATAGLHRLGPERREIAGVKREPLEGYLRAALRDRPITRRSLFEAAHLAYALARGQQLAGAGLQILFPVHGEPRGVAAAFLEDFPRARFIHTIREPVSNVASSIQHSCFNDFDLRGDALLGALYGLFGLRGSRYGRIHTPFLTRPYFPYVALADQARALKLEDLHLDGQGMMAGAAGWLDLQYESRLLSSTWDGKLWWNRPESGKDSRLGAQALTRNTAARLSKGDRSKIAAVVELIPAVRAAYMPSFDRSGLVARLAACASPWRQEKLTRRSEVRSLEAILKLRHALPPRTVDRLCDALRRERYRARLFEMTSGAIAVRRALPDSQKPLAVRAVLLVTPLPDGWRIRALAGAGPPGDRQLEEPDRLAVVFLDEATQARRIDDALFWSLVLTIGWALARLQTFIRVRQVMVRLLFRRAPVVHLSPLGPRPAENPSRAEMREEPILAVT